MSPITENELYGLYLRGGWDDVYDFPTFMAKCELGGMTITKEDTANDKE